MARKGAATAVRDDNERKVIPFHRSVQGNNLFKQLKRLDARFRVSRIPDAGK